MTASQAQLVLELVNYPGTDLALLDDEVGLDRRAAENITAYRNGTDQSCPSGDDELFDDLAELDQWQYMDGEDFEPGASRFVSRMDVAKQAIEEKVSYGWTPNNPTDADRLARLSAIHTALTAGPRSQPQAYWQATLQIDAAECSEDATIILDPATNHIWIMHRMPGC